jgi:hypothetical protein
MNHGRTWALLAWASVACAAETPPAAAPAPPVEEAIAVAKRDLETIKAARSGHELPRADLPQFSTPAMQVGPIESSRPGARSSAADAAAKKKSANWLVDAMTKRPETGAKEKDQGPEDLAEEIGLAKKDDSAERDQLAANGKREHRDGRPATEPVVNPLTSYMAGWMSAQDFKLLQPVMAAESASSLVARGEQSNFLPSSFGSGEASAQVAASKAPIGRTGSAPKENPFLQEFAPTGPPLSTAIVAAPAVPVAPAPAPKVFVPPPEPPAQKPSVPAFVKPNDDAKYFKPLKRF